MAQFGTMDTAIIVAATPPAAMAIESALSWPKKPAVAH